jgi:lysyl-tRNA synthetase class 2
VSRLRHHVFAWAPALAALAAVLAGLTNVASTLTPNIRWRGHLLLEFEPVEALRLFHAFALPAGAALLLVAPYLARRRRRAWQLAVLLMIALGVLDLLKGLDFEETIATWAAAGLLIAWRPAFTVEHDELTLRSALWRVPLLGLGGLAVAAVAAWATEGHPSWSSVARETGDLLLWRGGPLHFHHTIHFQHHLFASVPIGVHLVEIGTLLAMAYVVFRPLTAPSALPGREARAAAAEVVRAHGTDTLSFFKLRADKHLFFAADRSAFVGYRIEAGVLLLSGDPVGPEEAFPQLLADVAEFARARGLKLGGIGASERQRPVYQGLGLHTIYLGDEAIVDTNAFSLEGRPIRKVRQSVSRLSKAGFAAELHTVAELDPATAREVEDVLDRGRQGAPERGFSMAMDSIRGDHDGETIVVLARDASAAAGPDEPGPVRGVLHFVPCYGRPAVSLSFMRRDPDTPNGLTEFMVVRAIELLRDRGIGEMSLNFAAFARWMHSPSNRLEQVMGRLIALGNPFFQIESLYRFNAKFFPRWEPRYLVFQGRLGLPRTSLASLWVEGQLPKPELPAARGRGGHRPARTRGRGTLTSG